MVGVGTGTGTSGGGFGGEGSSDDANGEGGAASATAFWAVPILLASAASRIFGAVPSCTAMPSVTSSIASWAIRSSPPTSQDDSLTSTSPRPTLFNFLLYNRVPVALV